MTAAEIRPPLRSLLALGLFSLTLVPGCTDGPPKACTLIGCAQALEIRLGDMVRTAGTYVLVARMDRETATCSLSVPADEPSVCQGTKDRAEVSVVKNPSGGADAIWVQSAQQSVELTIERDGTRVAHHAMTPSYKRSRPNGNGCGPVCSSAVVSLSNIAPSP